MYTLDTPIHQIKGVGSHTLDRLKTNGIDSVNDLLLFAPLRYLDATNLKTINQLDQVEDKTLVTIKAQVVKVSQFRRGSRTIQTAIIKDETGKIKAIFFNSPHILVSLKPKKGYFFSGRYSKKYNNLTQPKFEPIKNEQIHTGRLVPYYSTRLKLAQGTIRRLIKHILDNLDEVPDVISSYLASLTPNSSVSQTIDLKGQLASNQKTKKSVQALDLNHTFNQLHFPKKPKNVYQARNRLALEEILSIIDYSNATKHYLLYQQKAKPIAGSHEKLSQLLKYLPFALTNDQKQALNEILTDVSQSHPMNRLLMGDVGTGKTIVAGLTAAIATQTGHHVAFIAPTTILAKQHHQNLKKLIPNIDIKLVTAKHQLQPKSLKKPTLFIGTHALINRLKAIRPALVIYDEQQKFGVWQRGISFNNFYPHTLNMTATPIPRSLMLTIFSHVSLSTLKTHPNTKKPVKTSVVLPTKRQKMFFWLKNQLVGSDNLALVIAPFIDPSYHEALENVKAVTELFEEYQTNLPELSIGLLHGRLHKKKQDQILNQLEKREIQLLIATPMIEVGVDLPNANVMIIESAERFGLANLHQLRGRVGRRGQSARCLLVTQTNNQDALEKLTRFSQLQDGEKIAELDLKYRGSGDIFGTNQHGLANLKFANWLNPNLIKQAQTIYQQLPKSWRSFLKPEVKVGVSQLN